MMNFEQVPEFRKELKKFQKKWRSLPDDIEHAKKIVEALYVDREGIDLNQYRQDFFATKRAAILTTVDDKEVVKIRLDVEALSTRSKVRIVFIAIKRGGLVRFIELYAKNEKSREDAVRIKRYLKE